ncbi:class I SAM-dependent methyltransferase [Parasphingopyxis algicola]|nr:class I SAM-dependent methyltransferase [Parasphingopyxis algicola]
MDIGPGYGDALRLARHMLPEPRLACVEFNQDLVRFYRSVMPQISAHTSIKGALEEFGPGGVKYVYAAHSLEHFDIKDLKIELQNIRNLLHKNGAFIIEVPHVPEHAFNAARNHTPHLIFFSRKGLGKMLQGAGFRVRLCVEVIGKYGAGKNYAASMRQKAPEETEKALAQQLAAVNAGDWIGAPDNAKRGKILKCVVQKMGD